MKKGITLIAKMVVLVLLSIIVGAVLLTLVYKLPTKKMRKNVANGILSYNTNPIEDWNKVYSCYTQTDMQTESIKLMEAVNNEGGSAFSRAMNSVYLYYKDHSQIQALIKYVTDKGDPGIVSYSRYWHGYLIYLKPLLLVMSIATIKILNMVLQFLLCFVMMILLRDKLGVMYSLAFSGMILVLNPVTIFLSMQNDVIFYIASISSIILLTFNDNMKNKKERYYYLFLFTGIAVAYFDFFTYPAVSIGVPLIIYILLNTDDLKSYIVDIIRFSFTWLFGYAGMWVGKWFLSDLLLGTSVVKDGLHESIYRSSGNPYGETVEMNSTFIHTVYKNLIVLNIMPLKIFAIAVILITIYLFFKNKSKVDIPKLIAVFVISMYPFMWYFAIRNHSVIHPWIEYRELGLAAFGLICCLGLIAKNEKYIGKENK